MSETLIAGRIRTNLQRLKLPRIEAIGLRQRFVRCTANIDKILNKLKYLLSFRVFFLRLK